MTEWLLTQIATWGTPLFFITNFLSCIAFPIPASLLMLACGAFAASGDIQFSVSFAACLTGAILGDQAGYMIGRHGDTHLQRFVAKKENRRKLYARAAEFTARRGAVGIFLTRWLFSPLGPYANFAAGAMDMNRRRFTIWSAMGEVVWVSLYTSLGYVFGDQITTIAEVASNISGLLAASLLALLAGGLLLHLIRDIET